jgi:hypothetical protein
MSSSSGSRVRFSNTGAPRGILKNADTHGRDSGVGSSSSDHTGSSSGDNVDLDDRFTARDYNVQSNDVSALQEALQNLIDEHKRDQKKCTDLRNENRELRKSERRMGDLYKDECDKVAELEERLRRVEDRMKLLDTTVDRQNAEIEELSEANKQLTLERDEQSESYEVLLGEYEYVCDSLDAAKQVAKQAGLQLDKRDSTEMKDRMKDRINRDQVSSSSTGGSSRPPLSRSSHATSDNTSSSTKRPSRRLSILANAKPYKEKMSSSSNPMMPSTAAGYGTASNYHLAPADPTSSSRRPAASVMSNAGSHRERRDRENGDYVPHPLHSSDRTKSHY